MKRRPLLVIAFFAGLVLLWDIVVRLEVWSPVLLPAPASVAEYLVGSIRDGTLIEAAGVTMQRLLIGYAIGLAIGLPLGFVHVQAPRRGSRFGAMRGSRGSRVADRCRRSTSRFCRCGDGSRRA